MLTEPFCSTECCKEYHGVEITKGIGVEVGVKDYTVEYDRRNDPERIRKAAARPGSRRTTAADITDDDPRHGTRGAYAYLGCRCPRCTKANREYHREYDKRRVAV